MVYIGIRYVEITGVKLQVCVSCPYNLTASLQPELLQVLQLTVQKLEIQQSNRNCSKGQLQHLPEPSTFIYC